MKMSSRAPYYETENRRHKNFINSILIFGMQALLSLLLGLQIFKSTNLLSVADFPLFCTRFICTIMLHIQLEPEIR